MVHNSIPGEILLCWFSLVTLEEILKGFKVMIKLTYDLGILLKNSRSAIFQPPDLFLSPNRCLTFSYELLNTADGKQFEQAGEIELIY